MIWNSIQLLFCQIVIVTPLALLFSYYIAKEKFGSGFFRIMLYLPQVISVVVLGLLFQYVVGTVYPKAMEQYFDKEVIGLLLSSSSYEQNFNTALIFTLWFSFGTNVLIYTGAMSGVDQSIVESAQLDGAGYWTVFYKIISPLCKPVYATVALFVAVGQWNSWFDAMIYNRMKTEYTTLQYELMKLLSSVMQQSGSAANASAVGAAAATVTPVTVRSAATIATMLPIVCLYPFLQRYFVTGLTIGGVKE